MSRLRLDELGRFVRERAERPFVRRVPKLFVFAFMFAAVLILALLGSAMLLDPVLVWVSKTQAHRVCVAVFWICGTLGGVFSVTVAFHVARKTMRLHEPFREADLAGLRQERLTAGYCPTCGYCIENLPQPRCPECGEAFEESWWRHHQSANAP